MKLFADNNSYRDAIWISIFNRPAADQFIPRHAIYKRVNESKSKHSSRHKVGEGEPCRAKLFSSSSSSVAPSVGWGSISGASIQFFKISNRFDTVWGRGPWVPDVLSVLRDVASGLTCESNGNYIKQFYSRYSWNQLTIFSRRRSRSTRQAPSSAALSHADKALAAA